MTLAIIANIEKVMVAPILEHRLILRPKAAALGRQASDVLQEVLDRVPPPV